MAEDETSVILIVVVALLAVVGMGLTVASFATHQSIGGMMGGGSGGMMGGGTTTTTSSSPGAFEWALLVLSAAFLVVAIALFLRSRGRRFEMLPATPAPAGPVQATPFVPAAPPEARVPEPATPSEPVPEVSLMKLLDADERRMYLELRDHGGEMYQRDIVALRIFSKAKVTRVLDKLEAKGLVVREAHGMTNRVRLVKAPAK